MISDNGSDEAMEVDSDFPVAQSSDPVDPNFLKLERALTDLISGASIEEQLHWRHYNMAMGMLLTILCPDYEPADETVDIWLQSMVHDDRAIRMLGIQVKIRSTFFLTRILLCGFRSHNCRHWRLFLS